MKQLYNNRKKSIFSFCLVIILCISLIGGCGQKETFEEFVDRLFTDEVTANTINLHFTLENPKSYGINKYEITFGDLSKKARAKQLEDIKKNKLTLLSYPYLTLSDEDKLTYEILSDYLDTSIRLSEYELYMEMLSPNNGLQIQLPILMAEYTFTSEKDVKDYLALLSSADEYYKQIISFEKEKAAAGLFMSDTACKDVIESCESFLFTQDNSFMVSTFEKRLLEVEGLSEDKKQQYIEENSSILNKEFFPAYDYLITELTSLLGSGTNDLGLCYYDQGVEYYEALVYSETGCDHSIEEIFTAIDGRRNQDLIVCASLQEKDSTIVEKCSSLEWQMEDPAAMLSLLQDKIQEDFPKAPKTTYEISYVDETLEEFLSPAFYITAPIDNYSKNHIYINSNSMYADIYYFTTLAHEGYPGHLYQTVYSYESGIEPLRSLLNYSGYVEGWGTYVEQLSYHYADVDSDIATFLSHNQSATLSLYASSDIGLHYYGWSLEDMTNFWKSYGISDEAVIKDIMNYILSEPGTYLSYYVGYMEFLNLKEYAEELYGEEFSLKEFHKAVLEIGPAPFHIIEKYLPEYYKD